MIIAAVTILAASLGFILSAAAGEVVKLPIVMYHSVVEGSSRCGDYVISAGQFESDVSALHEAGYETVNIADLERYVDGGELPEKPVMITFDDGFLNNIDVCGPILEKYDMCAVLSVVGVYTENEERCDWKRSDNYSYLTWEEIAAADKKGTFEIQNHSYNMHGGSGRQGAKKVSGEDAATFKEKVKQDITHMQELLKQKAGVRASCFTYPYGYFDSDTKDVIRECGFAASLICYERINEVTRDPECLYNLGRFNRPSGITTAQFFSKCGISLSLNEQ